MTIAVGKRENETACIKDSIVQDDIRPKRFGINYSPPAIVLEYLELSTGKLFHRRFTLRQLRSSTDAILLAENMRKKSEGFLAEEHVPLEQLVSLIQRLQTELAEKKVETVLEGSENSTSNRGTEAGSDHSSTDGRVPQCESAGPISESEADRVDYQTADLNKLSTSELQEHKAKMDVGFLQNQLKPGDEGFQYDVPFDVDNGDASDCGWDESDSD